MFEKIKLFLVGQSQDPFSVENRKHLVLIAFLAWIGLGADGLSSSCYGPALGYQALGQYHSLGLFLALLTAGTVFLIALSYNQVIELFPNGGGGYKVAKELLGDMAGLVSGTALIVDYMLTIAISIASGVQAMYSLLPPQYQQHIVFVEILLVLILMGLNLRGMKESIKVLLPIFMGFVLTHIAIIGYGTLVHGDHLPRIFNTTIQDTHHAVMSLGFIAVMAILLRAYSLGSGTYTGLEAVSNNVNVLAEPRIRTGKMTMLYMAVSLSIIAGGIILLYLLWDVQPVSGMTLNAAVFQDILGNSQWGHLSLIALLFFEAGLLLVGANTGYLGGPAVLANMSLDDWVPRRFSNLSSRLVKQNGIVFFGVCAVLTLFFAEGSVEFLVILYAINVFITFSISLLGLLVYCIKHRETQEAWFRRLLLSATGFIVCTFILVITVISKFFEGSWVALFSSGLLVAFCVFLKKHYQHYEKLKKKLDEDLKISLGELEPIREELKLVPTAPTAIFFVKGVGAALHTILWVERMFPHYFRNYLFVSYGTVDTGSFGSDDAIQRLQVETSKVTNYLIRFANGNGIAAKASVQYGAKPLADMTEMIGKLNDEYPQNVCFASQYIYRRENMFTRLIHSDFTAGLQRQLQAIGIKMLVVPLKLEG